MLAAHLYDSWLELVKNSSVLVELLIAVQIILSVIFFHLWKFCKVNTIFRRNAEILSGKVSLVGVIIFWILSTFVITPYLSFVIDLLFVVGFIILLMLPVVYSMFFFKRKVRDFLFCKKSFYYLQHLAIQQIIGLTCYVCIFKVRFWDIWKYSGDDISENLWLENIYPELGVLNRYCECFFVLLILFGLVYLCWGLAYGMKYLLGKAKGLLKL